MSCQAALRSKASTFCEKVQPRGGRCIFCSTHNLNLTASCCKAAVLLQYYHAWMWSDHFNAWINQRVSVGLKHLSAVVSQKPFFLSVIWVENKQIHVEGKNAENQSNWDFQFHVRNIWSTRVLEFKLCYSSIFFYYSERSTGWPHRSSVTNTHQMESGVTRCRLTCWVFIKMDNKRAPLILQRLNDFR